MSATTNDTPRASGLTGPFGQIVTVIVLVALVGFLAYVRFGLLPEQREGEEVEFVLDNPLLITQIGDCTRARTLDEEACMVVERRIERPRRGPRYLGGIDQLHRRNPYLVVGVHSPDAGQSGCAGGTQRTQTVLLHLNHFGTPVEMAARIDSIRPTWLMSGGREQFVYEVVLQTWDPDATFIQYVSPDMPVHGVVVSQRSVNEKQQRVTFRAVADCPKVKPPK